MDAQFYTLLSSHKTDNILLISFEDAETIIEIQRRFPQSYIRVFTKQDFVGKSISTLLRELRSRKYDLLVVSNRKSVVTRSFITIQLLSLFIRVHRIIFIGDKHSIFRATRLVLFLSLAPRLIRGALSGVLLFLRAHGSVLRWNNKLRNYENPTLKQGNKLKILYLRTDLSGSIRAGGSLSHMVGFIEAAKTLGHTIHIMSDSDFPRGTLAGVPITVLPPSPSFDLFDELQLMDYHYRVIRAGKKLFPLLQPDIIYHRHSSFNFSSLVLGYYFRIPVVLEANYSEVWARRNWSRLFFDRLAVAFERLCFRHADLIVTISKLAGQDIIALGADPGRVLVNPNAANPTAFHPSKTRANIVEKHNGVVVGFSGTFTRWHGVEVLMAAIKEISSLDDSIHFLLIGDGNLKHRLEVDVESHALHDRVTFTGLVSHAEMPRYLAACDVLVSPHSGFDDGTRFFGSPTKLFEYMAMGKAIVASNLEQIGEVIRDGVNGLLVRPGDAKDLAEKILLLARDPDLRRRLGEQARRDVEQNYTWEQNARRVLDALGKRETKGRSLG